MKALVIAEHTDAARELAAGARTVADEVVLALVGEAEEPAASADKVARIAVPADQAVENAAETVIALAKQVGADVVLAEPVRRVKVIAGKLAADAGTAVVTDITSLAADGTAKSLYFGGVAEREQKPAGAVRVYTAGAGAFAGLEATGANEPIEVAWVEPACAVSVVSRTAVEKSGVDLTRADVVVAAGRGFAEEADLDLARALCDKIGAGLGCSRPLTEGVNWLPTETYIGVSGLMLSPKVYVAAGISGQMQHMVGCNRAGVIFAINKDANAPVFKQCDYGLVGDVKTVLPALVAAL